MSLRYGACSTPPCVLSTSARSPWPRSRSGRCPPRPAGAPRCRASAAFASAPAVSERVCQSISLASPARPGSSRRKPPRATQSGLGSCLPPSPRPRQPNIWYATAADALHRGETFGHVTGAGRPATAHNSVGDAAVRCRPRPPGGSKVPMWIWRFPGLSFATRRGLRVKALWWAGPLGWLAGSGRAAVR
jgi:hypothetical protein